MLVRRTQTSLGATCSTRATPRVSSPFPSSVQPTGGRTVVRVPSPIFRWAVPTTCAPTLMTGTRSTRTGGETATSKQTTGPPTPSSCVPSREAKVRLIAQRPVGGCSVAWSRPCRPHADLMPAYSPALYHPWASQPPTPPFQPLFPHPTPTRPAESPHRATPAKLQAPLLARS